MLSFPHNSRYLEEQLQGYVIFKLSKLQFDEQQLYDPTCQTPHGLPFQQCRYARSHFGVSYGSCPDAFQKLRVAA